MARLQNAMTGVVVNVDEVTAERLVADGWAPAGTNAPAPTDDGQNDEVPSGSVAELTDWVGEDRGRAARALEAEQARGEKARSSLVAYLTKLLDAEQSDDE